jgi:hypothetical protein
VLETERKETEKTWLCEAKLQLSLAHRTVRWCTGQCPVREAGPREKAALGTRRRRTAKNHWTVQWCTGLSDEASSANSSPSGKAKRRRGYNSSDCPVSQRSPTVGHAIFARHVDCSNGRLVHQTVRCVPDSVRCANQPREATVGYAKSGRRSHTRPSTGPVRWRTGLSGAPLDKRQGYPSLLASNGS